MQGKQNTYLIAILPTLVVFSAKAQKNVGSYMIWKAVG